MALQRPEIELTPRRILAKRAWVLSDEAMAAPGILTHMLVDNHDEWAGDYPAWRERILRPRSRLQVDLECHRIVTVRMASEIKGESSTVLEDARG